jgi:hypothetical protein
LIHLSFSFDSIDYRKVKEEKIISTKKKAINESVKPVFPLPKKDLYNIPSHLLSLFNLEKLRKGLEGVCQFDSRERYSTEGFFSFFDTLRDYHFEMKKLEK